MLERGHRRFGSPSIQSIRFPRVVATISQATLNSGNDIAAATTREIGSVHLVLTWVTLALMSNTS